MASTMTRRRFECVQGSSDKFWEIDRQGNSVSVRFGRNGTSGQSSVKNFNDESSAEKHAGKMIQEKLGKGYIEVA